MENVNSFLLIKPDGVKMGLEKRITCSLTKAGLEILEILPFILTWEHISQIYDWTRQPIAASFMRNYLEDTDVILIRVSGSNALQITNRIKFIYRRAYEKHSFSNVVHGPQNIFELQRDLAVFLNTNQLRASKDNPVDKTAALSNNWLNQIVIEGLSETELLSIAKEVVEEYEPVFRDEPIIVEYSQQLIEEDKYPFILRESVYEGIDHLTFGLLQTNLCTSLKLAMKYALAIESGHQPVRIVIH